MPKKDGTPTALERRNAENHQRIGKLSDRSDRVQERFAALRLAVAPPLHAAATPLEQQLDQAEEVLDRLERLQGAIDGFAAVDHDDKHEWERAFETLMACATSA
jgi:hypothetical protein